jgi:hypothetical protein
VSLHHIRRAVFGVLALVLSTTPARAIITDPTLPISPASVSIPPYLTEFTDGQFNVKRRRICNNAGVAMSIGGAWATDSRHHYSKDQPFSHDGLYVWIEQKSVDPTKVILNAATWQPVVGNRNTTPRSTQLDRCTEVRWRPQHGHQMVGWDNDDLKVVVFDPITDQLFYEIPVPIGSSGDPGLLSEATITDDGHKFVISTHYPLPLQSGATDRMIVVDLLNRRCGPVFPVPTGLPGTEHGEIGNVNISPLGNWVYWKQRGTPEYGRRARINADLSISMVDVHPHGLRSSDAVNRLDGWLACLSHADVNIAQTGEEVVVGGLRDEDHANYCSDSQKADSGTVVMVYLESGRHRHISPGRLFNGNRDEAPDQHTSGRAYLRRGWHLVTYETHPTAVRHLEDEIVFMKLDGSRQVERYGFTRTDDSHYRGEAHSCPNPAGTRIMFVSNWRLNCTTCGPSATDVKSYVLADYVPSGGGCGGSPCKDVLSIRGGDGSDQGLEVALSQSPLRRDGIMQLSVREAGAARGVLYDVSGREVRTLLRSTHLERGIHQIPLAESRGLLTPGVYLYRFDVAGRVAIGRLVIVE